MYFLMILTDGDINLKTVNELVDNVYVLNLEDELFKYEILARKLDKKNIKHERFIATIGQANDTSLLEQFQMYARAIENYKDSDVLDAMIICSGKNVCLNLGPMRSPGADGCRQSNKRILEDAIKNDYESILIFQDDIYFHNEFDTLLALHYEEIKRSDIFYLGATEHSEGIKKNKWANPSWNYDKSKKDKQDYLKYRPTLQTYGEFGVYIHKNVFQELLEIVSQECFASDQSLGLLSSGKYKRRSWVSYPNLVIADMSFSSTFNNTYTPRRTTSQLICKSNRRWQDDKPHRHIDTWDMFGWDINYYDLEERYYPDNTYTLHRSSEQLT